jgi:hypothetical protein
MLSCVASRQLRDFGYGFVEQFCHTLQYSILGRTWQPRSLLPLGIAMQTIKFVHFVLWSKVAGFGRVYPLAEGRSCSI